MPPSTGGEYTVSHLSPLCSGCSDSRALLSYRALELRRLCAVAFAVFDAFIVLCSQLDITLDSNTHRDMLRTVTDSVRTERDRFTQFMFDRGRPDHQTDTETSVDPIEVYRWQIRLRRHSSVWNAAIAQLYAIFFPTKLPSNKTIAQLESWLSEQQQLSQIIADHLNDAAIAESPESSDQLAEQQKLTEETVSTSNDTSNDIVTQTINLDSDNPSIESRSFTYESFSLLPSLDNKPVSMPASLTSTNDLESDFSFTPADALSNDDLSVHIPASTLLPSSKLSSTMPSQLNLFPAASSPAQSPSMRPVNHDIPPPMLRAVTRSPSITNALTPSHFSSTQPATGNAMPPPQVYIETLFPALAAWPPSCVDFLREDNHRVMPVLPWSLPVLVCEDEPGSLVAYALASFEHLVHVGRLRQCDAELLKEASVECDRRQHPAYILPADRVRPANSSAKRSTPLQIVTQLSGISLNATPNTSSSSEATPRSAAHSRNGSQQANAAAKSDQPRQTSVPVAPLPIHQSTKQLPPAMSFNTSQITGMVSDPPEDVTVEALYKSQRQSQQEIEAQLLNETDIAPLTVTWQDVPQAINQSINQTAFSSIINAMTPDDRVSFSVTSYFPKQFHALRSFYSAGDYDIIISLCQCNKWQTSGGKSGSAFTKSKDERFVFKFVRKPELQTFLDFAIAYFAYQAKSAFHGLPSLLVPVLGAYQITAKRNRGERLPTLYALLMPNLFGEGATQLHFDLKGSTTNRYVPPSLRQPSPSPSPSVKPDDSNGQSNNPSNQSTNTSANVSTNPSSIRSPHPQSPTISQSTVNPQQRVLLDDNLLELTDQNGLPLSDASRQILRMAIFNDSLFLASQECVDYSLLLGIDPVKHYAVIGIIDYVRQYRSAERIETSIKSLTVAQPTVIPPQQYKTRFRQAMDRYFRLQATSSVAEESPNGADMTSPRSIDGSSDQYLQTERRHSIDTSHTDDEWTELDDFTNPDIDAQKLHLEQLFESPSFSRRMNSASSCG